MFSTFVDETVRIVEAELLVGGSTATDRLRAGGCRQGDALNRSRIATVVCVPLTSNLKWADTPANVLLAARATRLTNVIGLGVKQFAEIYLRDRADVHKRSATRDRELLRTD